jgi:hypothetical protein
VVGAVGGTPAEEDRRIHRARHRKVRQVYEPEPRFFTWGRQALFRCDRSATFRLVFGMFLECPEIVVSSRPCHRPRMSFFADSFRGDPHGTDPKFVRITEVFSLQFFRGTGGTDSTPRDLMLQRWYQQVGPVGPVGPVFANRSWWSHRSHRSVPP